MVPENNELAFPFCLKGAIELIISLVQYQQYKNIIVLDPCKTDLLSKVWLYQTPAIQPIGVGGGGGLKPKKP